MNSCFQPGDIVQPWILMDWSGTVDRIANGKALVRICDIMISLELTRSISPPVLAWVDIYDLVKADHHCGSITIPYPIEQRGSKTHNRNY